MEVGEPDDRLCHLHFDTVHLLGIGADRQPAIYDDFASFGDAFQDAFPCEKNGRYRFYWSPDSKYLAITGATNEIVIYEAKSGKILGGKSFDEASVIQWVPDGKAIAISRFNDESVLLEPVNLQPDMVAFTGGNTQNPWENQKILKNLDDCFVELEKLMGEEELKKFKNDPEKEASGYG